MRIYVKKVVLNLLLAVFLAACGSGGSSSTGVSNEDIETKTYTVSFLAKTFSSKFTSLSLYNGRLYFTNYPVVQSVPLSGGEIITHGNNGYDHMVVAGSKIFRLGSTYEVMTSMPVTSESIMYLATTANPVRDVATDGTYVYWRDYSYFSYRSKVYRSPIIISSDNQKDLYSRKYREELFTEDFSRYCIMVLDGDVLFVSDGMTGDIYRLDLHTGVSSSLVSGIGSGAHGIHLAVTDNYLYALADETDIIRIDKNNGNPVTVATKYYQFEKIRSDSDGVYWWDVSHPDVFLKRLDDHTGQITTLSSTPYEHDSILDFYSDGTSVWWFIRAGLNYVEGYHVPVTGGSKTLFASFDIDYTSYPRNVSGDSSNLYWSGDNEIYLLPKTGGIPSEISKTGTSGIRTRVILADTHFIFGDWDGVVKIPKSGLIDPTTEWIGPLNFVSASDLTKDDSSLYWSSNSNIYSMPFSGGTAQDLGTFSGNIEKVFFYDDHIFFLRKTYTEDTISIISKSGGVEQDAVFSDPDTIVDFYVINDMLYILVNWREYSGVYSFNLYTGELLFLHDSYSNNNIYVDSSNIYWTSGAHVNRLPINGGDAETIYSGHANRQITGDDRYVYWVSNEDILRMDK